MMNEIKKIKAAALGILAKYWAETAFISLFSISVPILVYLLICILAANSAQPIYVEQSVFFLPRSPVFIAASAAIVIIAYLCSCPLYLGIRWYYSQIARGNYMPVSSVFAPYRSCDSFFRAIRIRTYIDLRRLAVLIPCAICLAAAHKLLKLLYPDGITMGGNIVFALCIASAAFIFLLFTIKYIPAGYLIAEYTDCGADEILHRSRELFSKHSELLPMLYCSFAGWIALCIFMFPILFVLPYMSLSTALCINYCLHVSGEDESSAGNKKEKELAVP